MKAHVRPAHESDIDAIIPLLNAGFGAPWPPERWRRLFKYPGVKNQPNLGFVLESGDRLVGFLGAIYSERLMEGRVEWFCNFSSWHTVPEFRSSSIKLLMAALSQRDYTFVTLTPNQVSTQVVKALGFRQLESHKLLCGPRWYRALVDKKRSLPRNARFYKPHRALEILIETTLLKSVKRMQVSSPARYDHGSVHLVAGAELVRPILSPADQRLLDDHPQCGHFLVRDEHSYSYIVTVNRKISFGRRTLADFVVTDTLHCSSRKLALQRWESLCPFIAGHEGSQAILADERLFGLQATKGLRIPCHSYFMSRTGVNPNQIDGLYTEMALLDLPFYV